MTGREALSKLSFRIREKVGKTLYDDDLNLIKREIDVLEKVEKFAKDLKNKKVKLLKEEL